jgi:uncharacterized protein (DUF2235 family)
VSRLATEQERGLKASDGSVQQIAKYLNGVGDSNNFLVKAVGGAMGAGLITRIVRGYTFVSRNYAAGDDIYLLGFSRGAYTARALAGLIVDKGLLDASKLDLSDKMSAYRLGAAVWYSHLKSSPKVDGNLLAKLEEMALDLPAFILFPPRDDKLIATPINTVAVWDTVGSLGIPDYNRQNVLIDVFQFADTKLSPSVKHGRQAIAVDEQRADFTPTLWDGDARIIQVLFPGAHADVGGGYPVDDNESGLSDVTLTWMAGELAKLGVKFSASPLFALSPDPKGVAHAPWLHPPWDMLPRGMRTFSPGLGLAKCVLDRINGGMVRADPFGSPGSYSPQNLAGYVSGSAAAPGVAVI